MVNDVQEHKDAGSLKNDPTDANTIVAWLRSASQHYLGLLVQLHKTGLVQFQSD